MIKGFSDLSFVFFVVKSEGAMHRVATLRLSAFAGVIS